MNLQAHINKDILKAVSVRYIVNPELGHGRVVETEEMCRKTIAKLEWLNKVRPRVVLMADLHNKDKHAVMVRALGEKIAYIDMSQAPEIRGMLKESPNGMLTTTITEVVVKKHGYFFVRKPMIGHAFESEEIGEDWNDYHIDQPFVLPSEYFDSHDELSMVIRDELLPDLANVGAGELRMYFDRWMMSARYNQSREVQYEMLKFISVLAADSRDEVRQIALDIDHLRTKKNSCEVINEMSDIWWNGMLSDETLNESFSLIRQRCRNERQLLLAFLDKVEDLMRNIPGNLYNNIGDTYQFFSHLAYLAPPMTALSGILSLLAIRTLICKELNLPTAPFFGKRLEVISDVRLMPTTIGKVMDYATNQCRNDEQVATVQHLADFLRQDYLGMRDKQIEDIIKAVKPATNIFVEKNYGPCNGNIQEQTLQLPSPSQSNKQLG